jgi:hypothetical protein
MLLWLESEGPLRPKIADYQKKMYIFQTNTEAWKSITFMVTDKMFLFNNKILLQNFLRN